MLSTLKTESQIVKNHFKQLSLFRHHNKFNDNYKSNSLTKAQRINKFMHLPEYVDKKQLWKYQHEGGKKPKMPRDYQRKSLRDFSLAYLSLLNNPNPSATDKHFLLQAATGSGKTYMGFQIEYRLRRASKLGILNHPVNHTLYVTDRKDLLLQPQKKDFKYFSDESINLSRKKISHISDYDDKKIFFASFQMLYGRHGNHPYLAIPRGFFDFIIIDEAHRGADKKGTHWFRMLTQLAPKDSNTIVLGMTATPRHTKDTNDGYYGRPFFIYTLEQGFRDGYLVKYHLYEYKCRSHKRYKGKTIFNTQDRNNRVANLILKYETKYHNHAKCIIFCQSIEHAKCMAQVLRNKGFESVGCYTSKTTHKGMLERLENADDAPMIATTSDMLSTGIDIPSLRLIVLDRNIDEQIKLNQIIGRGTRCSKNKPYFDIFDIGNNFKDIEYDKPKTHNSKGHSKAFMKKIRSKRGKHHNKPLGMASEHIYYFKKVGRSRNHNGKLVNDTNHIFWRKQFINRWSSLEALISDAINYIVQHNTTLATYLSRTGYISTPMEAKFCNPIYEKTYDPLDMFIVNDYGLFANSKQGHINDIKQHFTNDDKQIAYLIKMLNNHYIYDSSLLDYYRHSIYNDITTSKIGQKLFPSYQNYTNTLNKLVKITFA